MAIRITQAGVALTVGIIIVTGLIIGGFFLVKNSGEQARRDEALKIAQQNLEEQSNDDVALQTEDSDQDNSAESEAPVEEDTATESTNSSNAADVAEPDQTASELPQTGPADQLSNLLVLALLTFSAVSYVSSRRPV